MSAEPHAEATTEPPATYGALDPVELRNGPRVLATHLVERLEAGDALNAFLLAAGLRQIAEDVLEADVARLADLHRVAGAGGGPARPLSAARRLVRGAAGRELEAWDAELGA